MAARSIRGAISRKHVNEKSLRKALRSLPLGGIRFFKTVSSTNDVALAWATEAAQDLSLVYADEQTQGRGRGDRHWITNPGSALAFSLILHPGATELNFIPMYSALGALAVSQALETLGLHPQIKWPNDVLLDRKKVGGILAESVWMGEKVDRVVLGIGVNIRPESVPPQETLLFPATCMEAEVAHSVDRLVVLGEILSALIEWRSHLGTDAFLQAWQERLAFRGESVMVSADGIPVCRGQVLGLERDGALRLAGENGKIVSVQFGDVSLRPVV